MWRRRDRADHRICWSRVSGSSGLLMCFFNRRSASILCSRAEPRCRRRSRSSDAFRKTALFQKTPITWDIRALAPELTGEGTEPLPQNPSQEKRWTKEIRKRLPLQIAEQIVPAIGAALAAQDLEADLLQESERFYIRYLALTAGTGYVRPEILLEFGARSTGEPSDVRTVVADAAAFLPGVVFPTASPGTMRPERTFWEKATAMHVYCAQGAFRGGNRFSRHWHDITRLDAAGFVDAAIRDPEVGLAVARHKSRGCAQPMWRQKANRRRTCCSPPISSASSNVPPKSRRAFSPPDAPPGAPIGEGVMAWLALPPLR